MTDSTTYTVPALKSGCGYYDECIEAHAAGDMRHGASHSIVAILSNSASAIRGYCDSVSAAMKCIGWLMDHADSDCWGSKAKVEAWVAKHRG